MIDDAAAAAVRSRIREIARVPGASGGDWGGGGGLTNYRFH